MGSKAKDKYIVSFNSDTSDSEDDASDGGDVKKAVAPKPVQKPPPEKKTAVAAAPLMNGHAATGTKQNGAAAEHETIPLKLSGTGGGDKKPEALDSSTTSDLLGDFSKKKDLDLAYSRAKDKKSTLASKKKTDDSSSKSLLIDLSDDNFAPTKTKPDKTDRQSSYSSELEDIMAKYTNTATEKKQQAPVVNGNRDALDLTNYEIKKNPSKDVDDLDFDADLLIYASSGTEQTKKTAKDEFSFDDLNQENGPRQRQQQNSEDLFAEDNKFRRPKPDEKESLLSPKDKYIEDKFSAICSKYGSKRDKAQKQQPPNDSATESDLLGTVRVKTADRETMRPMSAGLHRDNDDLGFSEQSIRPKKSTFDDTDDWDKISTEDLVKKILAEARGEAPPREDPRKPSSYAADGRDQRYGSLEPYERDMGGDRRAAYQSDDTPSLLERRLATLGGRNKEEPEPTFSRHRPKAFSEEPESFYKRKAPGDKSRDYGDPDTYGSSRYVAWQERSKGLYDDEDDLSFGASASTYQSHLRPPTRYEDSESDDDSYRRSREREIVLPEAYFKPQRSEETAMVVRERTAEVRNMVDNQSAVLGRLKKASESFDELDSEIKALKQQVIESQVSRQMILDDIIRDVRRAPRDDDDDDEPISSRRSNRSSYRGASVEPYGSKYSSSYTSPYKSSYTKARDDSRSSIDRELESDRLGGYALGSVAKSRYGEPGGSRAFRSASVSRFDNLEEDKNDRYGLYTPRRSARAGSCVSDFKSDYGAGENTGRSYNNNDDSSHRSRYTTSTTASSYGSYLTPTTPSRYDRTSPSRASPSRSPARAYSVTRESRSPARITSTSSTTSTSGYSYERPRARGTSLPPLESSSSSKPFTSRFLNKVREKKATGVDVSARDKPFKSRFLTRSFDSDYHSGSSSRGSQASTPDSTTGSSSRSYTTRSRDTAKTDDVTASGAAETTAAE